MGKLYNRLMEDVRFQEGLKACINCGTCTAICPAAAFYNYEPRAIVDIVQLKDDNHIRELLSSDVIWYCGECMSCKTRCPRDNTPGLVIIALRNLSQELGYFVESEKGRQQLALKRMIAENVVNLGYCVHASHVSPEMFPEQGPNWDWIYEHLPEVFSRVGANYGGDGPGALRRIPDEALEEIRRIFEVTGGFERMQKVEDLSKQQAEQMGMDFEVSSKTDEYFNHVFSSNTNKHGKE